MTVYLIGQANLPGPALKVVPKTVCIHCTVLTLRGLMHVIRSRSLRNIKLLSLSLSLRHRVVLLGRPKP